MQNKNKLRLGIIDYFIIFVVIVCIISAAIRYTAVQSSGAGETAQLEEYIVSFDIYNIRDSSAQKFLAKGTNFYLQGSNELVGTLREGVTIREAQKFVELQDGQIVSISNTGTGDLYRVDVEASLSCKGIMTESGSFLLNGNQYIGVNKEINIYSKYVMFVVKITGISKA